MKSDIDSLMEENNIDVLLVTGSGQHNPNMVYMMNGAFHLTQADLIKKRGEPPVLFHGPMERDEAARSGLETRSYSLYPWAELLSAAKNDANRAKVLRYERMFADLGIFNGRLAISGQTDVGLGYSIFSELQQTTDLTIVGYLKKDIFLQAMATKSAAEVEHIRQMGKITVEVVSRVADFLSGHAARDGVLVRPDGEFLTVDDVKSRINLWLGELGAENPEGTIFAIGRDAGVPHSSGTASDPLRLGQTIVFDIYPCEAGGGYYYDFTRTWCLGYAPDETQSLYEQVSSVYHRLVSELKVNVPYGTYQKLACELFEGMGHQTVMTRPQTEEGYVHSIGHGLGLHVHEVPFSGTGSEDLLLPGSVFTIEPGLYYPERGLGVRLENSMWITPDGKFKILADYPMSLVLPVKNNG